MMKMPAGAGRVKTTAGQTAEVRAAARFFLAAPAGRVA
jgi:hypothetical protein